MYTKLFPLAGMTLRLNIYKFSCLFKGATGHISKEINNRARLPTKDTGFNRISKNVYRLKTNVRKRK